MVKEDCVSCLSPGNDNDDSDAVIVVVGDDDDDDVAVVAVIAGLEGEMTEENKAPSPVMYHMAETRWTTTNSRRIVKSTFATFFNDRLCQRPLCRR